ncbi:MAG: single-stranded DNA-binding protein [Spirochaetales bacterium]|nr:single-stranded DNA-binding protein [Spirochaetales bacterium]
MAADINHVVIVGRLTRDAELKYTNSGTPVSKLGVAVNRRRKKDDQWVDEVSYFNVTLWGKTAESLQNYLVKGKQIGVDGELRQNRWEQDGQARSTVEIVANNIQLLSSAPGGAGKGSQAGSYSGQESNDSVPQDSGSQPTEDFEDDIPF